MGRLSNTALLERIGKANLMLSDFGGSGEAPLTLAQAREFFRIALKPQVMASDVRIVDSPAAKWQQSKIDFSQRILRPGTEFARLSTNDRYKPATGILEISTVLVRGEVPISDEVYEDQVEGANFGDTVFQQIAEAVGRDLEELWVAGDTGSNDAYLAQLDGWLKQAQGTGGNVYDASADGQDYQAIFRRLLTSMDPQFKFDKPNMRFYVPFILEEKYRDAVSSRGTTLGDLTLEGDRTLKYQGIVIKGVPMFPVTAGSPDTGHILLTHRHNLIGAYRRRVRIEQFRDPREGGVSFVVSARVDCKIQHVPATAIATNVSIEP